MSRRDRNQKKIEAYNIQKSNSIRAYTAVKDKPSKQAEEHFRRKPYYLKGKENEQSKTRQESDAEGKATGDQQY